MKLFTNTFFYILGFSLVSIFTFTKSDIQHCTTNKQENKILYSDSLLSRKFDFTFEGKTYRGILDIPENGAKTLMVLVHGHGKTNVISGKWNYKLRYMLSKMGIATFAYDKAGCGESEGTYNNNQTFENSAEEVAAAITELRKQKIPGSDKIGLWGISRAGWISPIVIKKVPSIAFWISASGPNNLMNMSYLLRTNWKILGRSDKEVNILHSEWQNGFKIQYSGGTYEEYVKATPALSKDEFIKTIRGGEYTEKRFLSYQKFLLENKPKIDPETNIQIAMEDYPDYLSDLDIPVLAIFGEKDSQVDWRKTKQLYKETIKNVTIITLPYCNHNIQTCETGGFQERLKLFKKNGHEPNCDNYFESIESWLLKNNLGKK